MIFLDRVSLPVSAAFKPEKRQAVTLKVERGGVCWVSGAAGSGKSALLAALALRLPVASEFCLLGENVTSRTSSARLSSLRQRIGLVDETPYFREDWSVLENVCLPLSLFSRQAASKQGTSKQGAAVSRKKRESRTQGEAILRWVGLGALGDEKPDALSHTQKLRLSAARALISRPDLLLVDAPALTLDHGLRDLLLNAFAEMRGKSCTLILATQEEPFLERLPAPVLRLPFVSQVSGNVTPVSTAVPVTGGDSRAPLARHEPRLSPLSARPASVAPGPSARAAASYPPVSYPDAHPPTALRAGESWHEKRRGAAPSRPVYDPPLPRPLAPEPLLPDSRLPEAQARKTPLRETRITAKRDPHFTTASRTEP